MTSAACRQVERVGVVERKGGEREGQWRGWSCGEGGSGGEGRGGGEGESEAVPDIDYWSNWASVRELRVVVSAQTAEACVANEPLSG